MGDCWKQKTEQSTEVVDSASLSNSYNCCWKGSWSSFKHSPSILRFKKSLRWVLRSTVSDFYFFLSDLIYRSFPTFFFLEEKSFFNHVNTVPYPIFSSPDFFYIMPILILTLMSFREDIWYLQRAQSWPNTHLISPNLKPVFQLFLFFLHLSLRMDCLHDTLPPVNHIHQPNLYEPTLLKWKQWNPLIFQLNFVQWKRFRFRFVFLECFIFTARKLNKSKLDFDFSFYFLILE